MILQVRVEPIENAPKDGTWFWALQDEYGMHPGQPVYVRWVEPEKFWYDAYSFSKGVSHYLPDGFPEIPQEATNE